MMIPVYVLNKFMDEELLKAKQNKTRVCCIVLYSSYFLEHLKEESWECGKKWQVRLK